MESRYNQNTQNGGSEQDDDPLMAELRDIVQGNTSSIWTLRVVEILFTVIPSLDALKNV